MRFKLRNDPSHNVKKTLDLRRGGLSTVFWVNIAESYIAKRADIWLNFRIRHFGRLMNQEYFARSSLNLTPVRNSLVMASPT